MDEWAAIHQPDFIVSTGDNIYPDGVFSEDDVRFDDSWKDVYTGENIADLVWYISVGNHDHGGDGNEFYQVDYGDTEPRWFFPALYWSHRFNGDDGATLDMFCIDSQSMRHDKNDAEAQYAWLEDSVSSSDAHWKIVFGHHPGLTAGYHGPGSSTIRNNVIPICEDYGVDILLTGHDHNLQHIRESGDSNNERLQHVLSGGGGRSLYNHDEDAEDDINGRGYELVEFVEDYGFITFDVTATTITMDYFTKDGSVDSPVYSFTITKE